MSRLLMDESDTWMKENDELRGLLNCGHTRDAAHVIRVEGTDTLEPRVFNVFCPKAIAGIGALPDTVEDRSIIVPLKRRRPDEPIDKMRLDRLKLAHIRPLAVRWAGDAADALEAADPPVPSELHDRAADNWRPLLAIADLAGGDWPTRARSAAIAFALADADEDTIGVLLLGDIKTVFEDVGDRITSDDLVERLAQFEDRPWAEWGKARKPITKVQVARLLAPFEIRPSSIRLPADPNTRKGYMREWFTDTFARYLKNTFSSGTPEQPNGDAAFSANRSGTQNSMFRFDPEHSAAAEICSGSIRNTKNSVPDEMSQNPSNVAVCSDVPDQSHEKRVASKVRCRDCACFDPDGEGGPYCLALDRHTDPDLPRKCPEFRAPL